MANKRSFRWSLFEVLSFRLNTSNPFALRDAFLCSVSGVLLTLSFPQHNLFLLAWIAFVPFFAGIEGKSLREAFLLGWTTGTVHFISLLYWVTNSMMNYGNLSAGTSFLLLVLLSLYLGLYVGAFGGALAFFRSRCVADLGLIAPSVWVLLEYLRTYLLTGFPWGLLGYSQYQCLSLIQLSDITGVYGISFLIVLVNTAAYRIVRWPGLRNRPFPFRYALLTLSVLLAVLFYGNFRKDKVQREHDRSPHLQVHLIQGNIEQEQKWEPAYLHETLRIYQKLTLEAIQGGSDLVVWPETAVPSYFMPELEEGPFFRDLTNKTQVPIVFGSLAYEPADTKGNTLKYFNSAFLASPWNEAFARYDKMHLVPFGEYVPLKPLLPFVEKIVVGIGDFLPGGRLSLFSTPQAHFGVLICYEIIFPGPSRSYREMGADFLVNITNDAWFGRTGAPYQHFAMAVFRAVENRTSVIRAANSGVSGIIEPTGRIQATTPLFARTFLEGVISIDAQPTFYARYGDIGVVACGLLVLLLGMPRLFRAHKG
jgi:apolipoprotein N-acyltransferase